MQSLGITDLLESEFLMLRNNCVERGDNPSCRRLRQGATQRLGLSYSLLYTYLVEDIDTAYYVYGGMNNFCLMRQSKAVFDR